MATELILCNYLKAHNTELSLPPVRWPLGHTCLSASGEPLQLRPVPTRFNATETDSTAHDTHKQLSLWPEADLHLHVEMGFLPLLPLLSLDPFLFLQSLHELLRNIMVGDSL